MDAVLFDMDGVLVDTEAFWHDREAEVILPAAVAGETPDHSEIRGVNYRETYDYLADNYEMALDRESFLNLYESVATDLYESAALMDGFPTLLDTLRDREVRVAVVSSSPSEWIQQVVGRFDLDVDAALSTEDIDGPGKPEPDVYAGAAARLGVDPADCVAVEDTPNGIRAATGASITAVAYGGDPEATELADHAARDPDELRGVFTDLGVLSSSSRAND